LPQVLDQQRFLKGGLSKLAEAEGTVGGLSRDAEKQRGVLKVKQAEADDALVRIQASMMQVSPACRLVADVVGSAAWLLYLLCTSAIYHGSIHNFPAIYHDLLN
jgi:hypothetical protein